MDRLTCRQAIFKFICDFFANFGQLAELFFQQFVDRLLGEFAIFRSFVPKVVVEIQIHCDAPHLWPQPAAGKGLDSIHKSQEIG